MNKIKYIAISLLIILILLFSVILYLLSNQIEGYYKGLGGVHCYEKGSIYMVDFETNTAYFVSKYKIENGKYYQENMLSSALKHEIQIHWYGITVLGELNRSLDYNRVFTKLKPSISSFNLKGNLYDELIKHKNENR